MEQVQKREIRGKTDRWMSLDSKEPQDNEWHDSGRGGVKGEGGGEGGGGIQGWNGKRATGETKEAMAAIAETESLFPR